MWIFIEVIQYAHFTKNTRIFLSFNNSFVFMFVILRISLFFRNSIKIFVRNTTCELIYTLDNYLNRKENTFWGYEWNWITFYGLGNSIKHFFNPYFNVNIKTTLRKRNLAHKCFVLTCVEYGKHPRTSKWHWDIGLLKA